MQNLNENKGGEKLLHSHSKYDEKIKPNTGKGYSFLGNLGTKIEPRSMKHINWRSARLSRGKKWYVSYQFRNPKSGSFEKFRVYEDINRIHDPEEKEQFGADLVEAINRALKTGFNPFTAIDDIPAEKRNWTLGEGLNYFKQKISEKGLRQRTQTSYYTAVRTLYKNMATLLNRDISTIKKHQIESALSNNDWSNTTYNYYATYVRMIFNFLIDAGVLNENPAKRIKSLPETRKMHRYFDPETWERIKAECNPELLDYFLFLYHTGVRPKEARMLSGEHIKGDRLYVPADVSKNRKDAYVPLSAYMQEKYKNYTGIFFQYSATYYSNMFQKIRRKLKLPKEYTIYSIKHTRAIHLAQEGANPYTIMNFFRHSSLDTTTLYLRDLGLNVNREAAEKGIKF